MKFASIIALALIASAANAAKLRLLSPLPEQPNQYSRICDAMAPENNLGCAAQVCSQ
jgi:hypothetical protein